MDGSDEDPDLCADWSCQEDQWKCQNNRCISLINVCDGGKYKETDCEDRSEEDEELCMNWNCSRGMWKCKNSPGCVPDAKVCDDKDHCDDGSDEVNCEQWTCAPGFWKCANNITCIEAAYVCDGLTGYGN